MSCQDAKNDWDYPEDIDILDAKENQSCKNSEQIVVSAGNRIKPRIGKTRSKLLDNVPTFLKQLKQSNEAIAQKIAQNGKESVIIATIEDNQVRSNEDDNGDNDDKFEDHVAMDIYTGVLEDQNDNANKQDQLNVIQQRTDKLLGLIGSDNNAIAQCEDRQSDKKSPLIEEI